MIEDLVAFAVAGAVGVIGGFVAGLRRRKHPPPPAVDRCVGFFFHEGAKEPRALDCTALRSPSCGDGRCSFHCRDMCKCDAPGEARLEETAARR